ncbi:hypothetical protein ACVIST_002119 [Bradyrhizobium elkanii]
MDQKQVDAIGAEPQQRLLHRAHGAVIGIVEHRAMRRAAGEIGAVAAAMERVHPAPDLGADDDVVARHAAQRGAAAVFGEAMAVERRRIQQVDAQRKRPLHCCDRSSVVEPCEQVAERRGAEADNGDIEPGAAEPAAWQCRGASIGGLLLGHCRLPPTFLVSP